MIRRLLVLAGVVLSVAFLPQTAWAATTEPTATPTVTVTETATATVTATPTGPQDVSGTVALDADQFEVFVWGVGLVVTLAAGSFLLGMRR